MKKYLITGGAGFIGSNLSSRLLKKGAFVRVFDNFSTGRKKNIDSFVGNNNFEIIEGDLRNLDQLKKAMDKTDCVFHEGALPSVSRSIEDPITVNNVNVLGTLNVLEAARQSGVKRVIYASSSSIYGNSKVLPKQEEFIPNPLSPYAISKFAGEKYCQIYYKIYGLETVCLRYFNVFGPNQDPLSHYAAVIPRFVNLMKKDESPIIYGDGKQSRDFTYVDNVINANLLASDEKNKKIVGEVFNIACGERFTLLQLIDSINIILNKKIKPKFLESRPGDVKHSCASIEKAKNYLKYKPEVNFFEGLKKLIEKND